jgi:transcription termination factor Rho
MRGGCTEAARPPEFVDSGQSRPIEGRNPLSDTTDVTSDVSNVAGDATTAAPARRRRSGTGLSAMLLPELQSLAASLGISGTARMRKGELISAITERQ